MASARLRAFRLLGATLLAALPVSAATSPPGGESAAAVDPAGGSRDLLVLRVEGSLDAEREAALTGLVSSELGSTSVTLTLERSTLPLLRWTAEARRNPRALVLAILDVRDPSGWALYVVDAARGRAILRRLPGGVDTNAAALEEVSAILTSAVAAVREGLEVASKPVEAVMLDDPPPERPPPPKRRARPPPDVRPPPHAPAASGGSTGFFAGVFARGATLTPTIVPGVAAEVGVSLPLALSLALGGAHDLSARVATELGAFELERSLVSLKAGRALFLGPLSLEPRVGSGAELIRRSDAAPVAGVVGRPARTHGRLAILAGVELRYPIAGETLWLALGLDGSYAPQPLRFTEEGRGTLLSLPSWAASGRAGIVLALGR